MDPGRTPAAIPSESSTDADLLTACARGEQQAFGILVRRHLRSSVAAALAVVGDLDEAEDVTQDAFIVVLRRANDFDTSQPFAPWLLGIVRNIARRVVDRGARRRMLLDRWQPELGGDQNDDGGDDGGDDDGNLSAHVGAAVADLPEMQRQCFTLRVDRGLGFAEIASRLGVSESTARQHVFRARVALRKRLGEVIPE